MLWNTFYVATEQIYLLVTDYMADRVSDADRCTLIVFSTYLMPSAILHLHALVTVNRIWAVTFPVHHKNHHSRKIAIILYGSVLTYVHICIVPGCVMNGVYLARYPAPCSIQTQFTPMYHWMNVSWRLNYDFPLVFLALGYVFIVIKRFRSLKRRHTSTVRMADLTEVDNARQSEKPSDTGNRQGKKVATGLNSRPFVLLTLLTVSVVVD